ncbi:MAG: dTDP-4-dehydrorhamnose reductase [Roseomonas sp.]|nr:dTDP-4-dehydrorhamnose reductase [Roseomonas sp.]MCA3328419.1 dTDP-4-dehydrorhamnose reductase [Roseomonas sp.]MCA3332944.1 dTDP-4-dehydrorhamnose reductase [Roseomonas sp.]MCA3336319.1 dTDP-4-dehydrorhamnose reductase [Roseomonas sp.]MCA3347294.1 dTDP-4-dehydrorhamnose reductase [Roseomonas sp.]
MRRILVTGRGGQLATGLEAALPVQGFAALLVGQPEFEFDKPETVAEAFHALKPDAVVNCAAWTAVDAAEDDEAGAFRANALGPALLGRLTHKAGIPLLQISTDYVFDGLKGAPYLESDLPNPVGAYGRTKLAGEWAAQAANPRCMVLRTAWVFAPMGKNFLRTMLALGEQRPELRVVADQWGSPTAAPDLADAITAMLAHIRDRGWRDDFAGTYHATGGGFTTWHGFAEAIFTEAARHGAPHPKVHAITTADYPTKARRPADGRLDNGKLARIFGVALPPWEAGLARVMAALRQG